MLGVTSLLLVLVSRSIRRTPVSEPLVALGLGVVVGPAVLGLVDVDEPLRDLLLLEGSRLLLALSVTAAALRFQVASLRMLLRPVAVEALEQVTGRGELLGHPLVGDQDAASRHQRGTGGAQRTHRVGHVVQGLEHRHQVEGRVLRQVGDLDGRGHDEADRISESRLRGLPRRRPCPGPPRPR